jgi:hypothetical protein
VRSAMSEEGGRDWRDPEDRWCVECRRNVSPQRAGGPLTIAVSATLMLVLGAAIDFGFGVVISADVRPGMLGGAFLGVVAVVLIVAAEPRRCPI